MKNIFRALEVGLKAVELWLNYADPAREVEVIPEGAKIVIVGGIELLQAVEHFHFDLPSEVMEIADRYRAVIAEHVDIT